MHLSFSLTQTEEGVFFIFPEEVVGLIFRISGVSLERPWGAHKSYRCSTPSNGFDLGSSGHCYPPRPGEAREWCCLPVLVEFLVWGIETLATSAELHGTRCQLCVECWYMDTNYETLGRLHSNVTPFLGDVAWFSATQICLLTCLPTSPSWTVTGRGSILLGLKFFSHQNADVHELSVSSATFHALKSHQTWPTQVPGVCSCWICAQRLSLRLGG